MMASEAQLPRVVELAVLEANKENVQPKRSGRNVNTLATIFGKELTKGPEVLDEDRAKKKTEFEALLRQATSEAAGEEEELPAQEDTTQRATNSGIAATSTGAVGRVLQLWFDYAAWAAEWYPSTSSEERSILERATRSLASEPSCKGDPRYLRLWLRLADKQKDPQELFCFMWRNDIGCTLSAFYEAWALFLVGQSRYYEAAEVVSTGLVREACPSNRLRSFQQALASQVLFRLQNSDLDSQAGDSMPQRPTLNPITADEAKCLTRPLEQRPLQPIDPCNVPFAAAGLPGLGSNSVAGTYFDESSLEPEQRRTSIYDAQADWYLPPATAQVANKENTATAVAFPWDAQRQHQQAGGSRRGRRMNPNQQRPALPSPALPVFIDPEFQGDISDNVRDVSKPSGTARASSLGTEGTELTSPRKPACSGLISHAKGVLLTESMQHPSTPVDRQRGTRQRRRAFLDEEDELTFASLAADLSGLRLREEPPAKKICLPSSASSSSASRLGRLQTLVAGDAALQQTASVAAHADMLAAPALAASAAWTAMETPPRRPGRNEAKARMASPIEPASLEPVVSGPSEHRVGSASPHGLLQESRRQGASAVVPWESDPGFLEYGVPGQRDNARYRNSEELNALNALGSLFPGRSSSTASSRPFIFED
eukprot:TRINITY_DN13347_c0_g1_i1.p1 TRINITY_DN13347_c0_g1~~TRINITY_DN13347_c0_g1_i1.p1  ORF type:complete len:666 (+),score=113.75 TRINITY_DN13347_c0_g1_i1:30-2000(+)